MERMAKYKFSEEEFAHFVGKLRMYQHLEKADQKYHPVALNDGQVNTVTKNYYRDAHFKRSEDGSIDLWRLYNLFTEANKSSYIDKVFNSVVSVVFTYPPILMHIHKNRHNIQLRG